MPFSRFNAVQLSVDSSGALPTEFRLFVRGWNETENGRFLFDDAAAKAVMSAYADWGVDLAIDLEHQMLDGNDKADPTARDARGWCKLSLRPDGSLWAVDVKWTPDGAERLSQGRQRYVSPAFEIDPDTKRVTKLINVAITSIPATHKTPALVAASKSKGGGMDPSLVKQALDAVEKGDAKSALEILKGLIASAAGAEPDGDESDAGSEGDGAEGAPGMETESVEDPKVVDASAEPPAKADGDDDGDEEEDPAKKTERKAMSALLLRTTGTKSIAEALSAVETYKASHLTLEHEKQKLAKERATLEAAERRDLVTKLIKLGAEFPATIWANDKASAMKPRWAKMPIAELRMHVEEQKRARGGKAPSAPTPAPHGVKSDASVTLSKEELEICEQTKCDPKVFAHLKAVRDGAKRV